MIAMPPLTRCPICGAALHGLIGQDSWGNAYCARHQGEHPTCLYCSRLICPALTGGAAAYPDGRAVCARCGQTAVTRPADARLIVAEARAWLARQGIVLAATPDVALLDRATLAALLRVSPTNPWLHGIARMRRAYDGKGGERRAASVGLLWGLPRERCVFAAVHELGHVWLFLMAIDSLSAPAAEGFCNLLGARWLEQRASLQARHDLAALAQSADPTYGDGYRRVRALADRDGLPALLARLRRGERLPI